MRKHLECIVLTKVIATVLAVILGVTFAVVPVFFKAPIKGMVNTVNMETAIYVLQQAKKDTVVTLNINSPGGYVNVGAAVIETMQKSKAKTIQCTVVNQASSMAALILTYCDKIAVDKNAYVMFHMLRLPHKVILESDPQYGDEAREYLKLMLPAVKLGLLTAEEFARVRAGEDVFIKGDVFMERIKNVNTIAETKAA